MKTRHKNNLRFYRQKYGFSVAQACEALGANKVMVSRWELGYNYPQFHTIGKFEKFYGARVQDLWPGVFE